MKPGCPPGVINVVTASASRRDGVNEKSRHSENRFHRFDADRKLVAKNALDTMKRLTLELGGKSLTSSWTTPISPRRFRWPSTPAT